MMPKHWRKHCSQLMLVTAICVLSVNALATPPNEIMLTSACSACHGTQGVSAGLALPHLAGMPKEMLVDTMQEFKNGSRPASIMGRIAQGYSDADFAVMGEYFNRQKPQPSAQNLNPDMVAKGATLAQENCGLCHITQGRRAHDDPPILSGQWLTFMQMQMQMYLDGTRKMPLRMAAKVRNLAPQDLQSILQYYASLN